jgi:SAM-dependent methyltransferase
MGDILESCGAHGAVALVHSNCLLSTAAADGRTAVKSYYSEAAVSTKEDILNPACYPPEMMEHIPEDLRFRGYGCGSPVLDAAPQPGQTVVDLGCGRGVECFLAARAVGPEGRVIGVDMLDPMLEIAREGAARVSGNLGYENMRFDKGYLEALPLESDSADLVLSNCVLNLSSDKRRTFAEILRVLKPGGRVVVSDVVTETVPRAAILNDDVLRGECIAGAMTHRDLVGILDETGFHSFRMLKRVPYRDVRGHRFHSMTYEAMKPAPSETVQVIYRGPMASLQTPSGHVLFAGMPSSIPGTDAQQLGDQVAILDRDGRAVNMEWANTCACALPNTQAAANPAVSISDGSGHDERRMTDCMVCGSRLIYLRADREETCAFCGAAGRANATCKQGHFVCDACHAAGALAVIGHLCATTDETDMVALMQTIRRHPSVPMHGPEHHGLVPGAILATYRNLGGAVTREMLDTGIRRGARVMGGACAFTGSCGAASGVGVAFSLILDANPLTPEPRQRVMRINIEVARAIAAVRAARCCQRDVWIALTKAAELSSELLPIPLRAETPIRCRQFSMNEACLVRQCPLWGEG